MPIGPLIVADTIDFNDYTNKSGECTLSLHANIVCMTKSWHFVPHKPIIGSLPLMDIDEEKTNKNV